MRAKTNRVKKLIAVALALIVKRKNKAKIKDKRKGRLWVKELQKGGGQFSIENLETSPNDFRNCIRMNPGCYDELLSLVTPLIERQDTQMRKSIPVNQRFSVTLHYLATGSKFEDMQFTTGISAQAIGKIVMETCEAIIETLKDYIKLPTRESEWEHIAEVFGERLNFPNCIGAVDGKHIAIKKPPGSGSYYYNYKRFPSIVLMAVVNANYEFIVADVGANGQVSDGGVFSNSSFGRALKQGTLNIPKPSKPPFSCKELPYSLVGDDAFQLTDNFMKPYPRHSLHPKERIFNYRLGRARRIVDNVFGILFARFGVLQRTIGLVPEKAEIVVLACCYLHNFLRKKCEKNYIPHGMVDVEDTFSGTVDLGSWRDEVHLTNLQPSQSRNATTNAKLIRDSIALYFSAEGRVPWQSTFL